VAKTLAVGNFGGIARRVTMGVTVGVTMNDDHFRFFSCSRFIEADDRNFAGDGLRFGLARRWGRFIRWLAI
jgi:hypothetical protein